MQCTKEDLCLNICLMVKGHIWDRNLDKQIVTCKEKSNVNI
jgi:hypothetical protein